VRAGCQVGDQIVGPEAFTAGVSSRKYRYRPPVSSGALLCRNRINRRKRASRKKEYPPAALERIAKYSSEPR
jgi:hypothetical protein